MEASHFTLADKPSPPENLKVKEVRKDHVRIAWSVPETDGGAMIKNYVIEKRDVAKNVWVSVGTVDSQTFDFNVSMFVVCP